MLNISREIVQIVISVVIVLLPGRLCQFGNSPCPNVFQYQYEDYQLHGIIRIQAPDTNEVKINVELSVGNVVNGYNGHISLTTNNKQEIIDNIINHRPIVYKLHFPAWQNIPPKITRIFVNGNLICSGPKISGGRLPIITTINLQHVLRISLPLSAGTPSDNSNFITPTDDFDPKFNGRPTDDGNEFNFRPALPPIKNNINFRPQMPDDPSKVLPGNPFFIASRPKPSSDQEDRRTSTIPSQTEPQQDSTTLLPRKPVFRPPQDPSTTIQPAHIISKDSVHSSDPYSNICGKSLTTNSLIVNGESVPRGAYPWLVAIFWVKNAGPTYVCTGSLISDRHIVTAAHCIKQESRRLRAQELLVVLGKINIKKWAPTQGERMLEPASVYVHPDYQTLNSDADIAVIELGDPIEFTNYIRPLCLWSESTDLQAVVGKQGTVVGWGKDENGVLITQEPKQTKLPIVSQEECLRSSYQFQYITSNRTFCAGFRNGSGPCNGDSGGGFIIKVGDRWMLKGIVSMSISEAHARTCDLTNYVVFTDASKFLDWLRSFVK